jgi:mono/diheme cytochrome c family protein
MKKILLTVLVFAIAFAGCYYDKGVIPPNPTNPIPGSCDTLSVRYSVEIKNILSTSCYACHSGTAANGGGLKYDVYPGDLVRMAQTDRLVLAITHGPGASPMPKGGGMLSACDIAKIRTWARNGAPNN